MPYVCTGKFVAGGKRFAYGERVPTEDIKPFVLSALVSGGILRQVSDEEAKTFTEKTVAVESVSKLRNLTREYAAAKMLTENLSAELGLLRGNVADLQKKLDAARSAEQKSLSALEAHKKGAPAAIEQVAKQDAPRVVTPAPTPPAPPVVTEDDERRVILSSIFAMTRGDLIAYAGKKYDHKDADGNFDRGPKEGPFDLSKLKSEKKEAVQKAFVDAMMLARHPPKKGA